MVRKAWKMIKDNFSVILAIGTTLFTIVYAGMKLLIYVYWSGYFNELNIDTNTVSINYDGHIFQVIFYSVILLFVVYLMTMMDRSFCNMKAAFWKEEKEWFKRLGVNIKVGIVNFIVSIIFLLIANLPLVLVICVFRQKELSFFNICGLLCVLYITEMLIYLLEKLDKKESVTKKKTIEQRVGGIILYISIFLSFVLAITYCIGSQSVSAEKKLRLVENEEYAITYSDGEHYVLHRVKIEENKAVLYRNEQKIISIEDCEYLVVPIEKIMVNDN